MRLNWFLFGESMHEELSLLSEFIDILKNFDSICTFNGKAFDIPYLLWRFEEYNLISDLEDKESIDMSRDFRPLKSFINIDSL